MNTYKIAELIVRVNNKCPVLERQAKMYAAAANETPDILIDLSEKFIEEKQKENPHLSIEECIYIWTSSSFYLKLLSYNGFPLHASAIAMDNKAYLFSAKSGMGKSTHTRLWRKYLGEDRVKIINDDKPVMRLMDNKFYVYGTPWSGKSDKNLNIKVPLQSITFIEQSQTNWIEKLSSREAVRLLLKHTLRPTSIEKLDLLLYMLDKLLKVMPIYKMGCNISEDAVKLAYETLNNAS